MAIHTRVIGPDGKVGVAPCRLVATDDEATITNRDQSFSGDYLPNEQPFLAGEVTGDPGTRFFVIYSGQ